MSNIQIIKPNSGQKNWGDAINKNFELLYSKYTANLLELQGIRDRLDELDTLQIQQDTFIYMDNAGKTFVCYYDKLNNGSTVANQGWLNPTSALKKEDPFNPANHLSYVAWFVQTQDNEGKERELVENEKYVWHTGDLLIIRNQSTGVNSLNTNAVRIEQWKNLMGGYFQPVSIILDTDNKRFTTTYKKTPGFSVQSQQDIHSFVLYWKPISYNSANRKLNYQLYYIDESGNEQLFDSVPVNPIEMTYITNGGGNYGSTEDNEIEISNAYKEGETVSDIGFDVHFTNSDGDILYLPYSYEKVDTKLKITLLSKPSGTIDYRVNVFRKV